MFACSHESGVMGVIVMCTILSLSGGSKRGHCYTLFSFLLAGGSECECGLLGL